MCIYYRVYVYVTLEDGSSLESSFYRRYTVGLNWFKGVVATANIVYGIFRLFDCFSPCCSLLKIFQKKSWAEQFALPFSIRASVLFPILVKHDLEHKSRKLIDIRCKHIDWKMKCKLETCRISYLWISWYEINYVLWQHHQASFFCFFYPRMSKILAKKNRKWTMI